VITCLSVSSIIATMPLQMIVISISVEGVVVDAPVIKLKVALSRQTSIHRVVSADTILLSSR
jgi:hypothetical protein